MKELFINRAELKKLTAEELMVMYQLNTPEEAYAAFDELYDRYSSKVFSFVMKKLRHQADAEDLLQKIFFKMHESKHLYKPKFKFEQWLFVIARTAVLDHHRARTRYQNRLDRLETEQNSSVESLSSEALSSLDDDQKEMLEMKFIDELSYLEMSKLLNKSETSLRKMVSRMMINLRKGEV